MQGEGRPGPDRLLHQVQGEEKPPAGRGRLKIFFGYAAGVGKTCAMLSAAHAAQKSGVDVVAGHIDPHGRPAVLALLEGLEQLPPLAPVGQGAALREFDLDAALARRPALILVDELAHANAAGCRHRKRYQDVETLLRAGVDVYTTVSVQHLESLSDVVASITGAAVQERVPDSVFDSADQVELIDIEPEELIARLGEGKSAAAGQAKRALSAFLTREDLTALREIARRRTADRVNRIAEREKHGKGDRSEEHILICLSGAPSNASVIRAAARMAGAFHGSLTALFVETPDAAGLEEGSGEQLRKNLRLAEQLGARIATVYGENVAQQIADYARESGVSKIVLGRSAPGRRGVLARRSLAQQLAARAPGLDVCIIPDGQSPRPPRRHGRERPAWSAADLLRSAGILAVTSLLALLFRQWGFTEANIVTLYILGVLFISMCTHSWAYGAISAAAGVLIFNYLFTEPLLTLKFNDKSYYVTFVVMFLASFLTGTLTMRVRRQARQAASKAYRTEILLETSQKLQHSETEEQIFTEMGGQLLRLVHRPVLLYPVQEGVVGEPAAFLPPGVQPPADGWDTAEERAVAAWVAKNNKHAGATTDTLPGARCLYLAVRGRDAVFAVAGLALGGEPLDIFERSLMIAMLGEFGLAVEKQRANEEKRRFAVEAEQERLRADLLRAISHDLRTPLTSISGNAGILMANGKVLDEKKRQRLYADIYDDSMWLINLVENLLAVTRIENGAMSIQTEPELVNDVVDEALAHTGRKLGEHRLALDLPDELLMARMDARLIVQVLVNLVDNAVKYTPPGSTITVSARRDGPMVRIEVADDGPGVPDEAKERLFEMFYTAQGKRGDGRRGLGLGLPLCRSIVSAHGGVISVRDNRPAGTVFSFTLKAEEVTCHEQTADPDR
ncbi:sensor histidine kinase KdpD [Anaerofilum sp. BX8]|uniref:histidine kinase n=1 Tax=Anaerofilum hominis TaxID=2763016 RepID=A0A923I6J5_9FIRM|nr:sensor histidine kinase KdpD [Anaerofilum hominis]